MSSGLCPDCTRPGTSLRAAPPRPLREAPPDLDLLEEIGRGGSGIVYRAIQKSLDRPVAVKFLREDTNPSPLAREQFLSGAAAAATLHHPHIVAIHETGSIGGLPYCVMEWIDGPDLAAVTRSGPVPIRRAVEWVLLVSQAVQHAHDRGVLHQDLKPSNVIVDATGTPYLADFGMAHLADPPETVPPSFVLRGTPGYMAPEQVRDSAGEITRLTDVYGLGALLFHLLTGRAPFVADSAHQVLLAVTTAEPVSPRLFNPAVTRDLETIVFKALNRAPTHRYPSATAFSDELRRFLEGKPVLARPPGRGEQLWRWGRRQPTQAGLVGLSLLFLITLVVGIRVTHHRLAARTRATEQVKEFLETLLGRTRMRGNEPDQRVADCLIEAAHRSATQLGQEPLVRAEVESALGNTFYQLALYDEAEPLLRSAVDLFSGQLGPHHSQTAEVRSILGSSLVWSGKHAEGIRQLEQAVASLRRLSPKEDLRLIRVLEDYASALLSTGYPEQAVAPLREVIARGQGLGAPAESTLVAAYGDLALALSYDPAGLTESEVWLRRAIDLNRRRPDGRVNLATGLVNLAEDLILAERLDEAEAAARECLQIRTEVFGAESSPTAFAHSRLASVLDLKGQLSDATGAALRGVAILRATLPPDHRDLQYGLRILGTIHSHAGRFPEAEACLRESLKISGTAYGPDHPATRSVGGLLATALAAQGQFHVAQPLAEQAVSGMQHLAQMHPRNRSLQARLEQLRVLANLPPSQSSQPAGTQEVQR